MASAASASTSVLESSLHELEHERDLISACTRLWKDLSDHLESVDRHLRFSSSSLHSKFLALDSSTELSLSTLLRRERSASAAADLASSHADRLLSSSLLLPPSDTDLTSSCLFMDPSSFLSLLLSHHHQHNSTNLDLPSALRHCVDPPTFALDALAPSSSFPFPAGGDHAWACVAVLEALAEVLRDPVLGEGRKLITPSVRRRAETIAATWKENAEKTGGTPVKAPDAHVFLQHVATFDLAREEDHRLYRKLVVAASWRRQIPRLALELGLGDRIDEIIEELINKGQQLDAVNFTYEANLVDKYPPVPLLKAYLESSVKAATSILEERKSARAVHLAGRKEQSALRAVIKCIEEHKLESEFPPEELKARLEQLEKAKTEKKKPAVVSVPANKRTRSNSGGPMPPAKAGRLTNRAHVSSFPSPPSFMRSPSTHSPYSTLSPAVSPYGYDGSSIHSPYGSQSPPAIRDPYAYRHEEVVPPPFGMSYTCTPLSYPLYAGYSAPPLSPGYQPIYYR